ncbi:hypothetical protein [Altererythrobacter sp. TH136]|uniref:hypothetical protein n=1 Tax=Altererythrobacter sp. TH136 TaxID=2067415 RepID=UPI001162CBAD|nr:hypothetical protein [Altererythrobacter sp. TH136]QDM39830.1 hypothetical protein C0V74_01275 [Altererythrobacter sp. TH136]
MVDERITEVRTPAGDTHTTHTVVTDGERRGGGSGWVIALVLIVALIAAIWFFSGMSNSESAKDNAIADAASDVGNAAEQVGNAAQDAADNVTNNN